MVKPKNNTIPPKGTAEKKGKETGPADKKGKETGPNKKAAESEGALDSPVETSRTPLEHRKEPMPDAVEVEDEGAVPSPMDTSGVLPVNKKRFVISEEDWSRAKNRLTTKCIMVFCNSSNPKMLDLRGWMAQVWERAGLELEECRYMGRNFYLVTFVEPESVIKILTTKQAMFCKGSPVVAMPWTPNFDVQKAVMDKLPCWVEIHGLPVELAIIADESIFPTLGEVLEIESKTPKTFISSPVCRACVMLDMKEPRIYELESTHPETGNEITARVLYKNLPLSCFYCGCLDHMIRECPKRRIRPVKTVAKAVPAQIHSKEGDVAKEDSWVTVGAKGKKIISTRERAKDSEEQIINEKGAWRLNVREKVMPAGEYDRVREEHILNDKLAVILDEYERKTSYSRWTHNPLGETSERPSSHEEDDWVLRRHNLNKRFEELASKRRPSLNDEEPDPMLEDVGPSEGPKGDGYMYDGDDFIPLTENEEVMVSVDGTPIGRRTRKKSNASC